MVSGNYRTNRRLDGVPAMDPDGPYLQAIDGLPAGPAAVHAMTSNYAAAGALVPGRALDLLTDALFGAPNDLVVPTDGRVLGRQLPHRRSRSTCPAAAARWRTPGSSATRRYAGSSTGG